MKTALVWFRNDLRVHDNPALHAALSWADQIVPVFVFNDTLLHGKHSGANRNRFLVQSLEDLRASLRAIGGDLIIRKDNAAEALMTLAKQTDATTVFAAKDYSPYAQQRDAAIGSVLKDNDIAFHQLPGRLIIDDIEQPRTKTGKIQQIFTPFWRNWQTLPRREILPAPGKVAMPDRLTPGDIPTIATVCDSTKLSPSALRGGESEALVRLESFLDGPIGHYHETHNQLAVNGTSRLSAYLHFGCISPLYITSKLPDGDGAAAFHRQLAWRDFYYYVLHHFPDNAHQEFQEKYRTYDWSHDASLLHAWQDGITGYPVVDAAMRQLKAEGWMHNRARLIVGSFLTKDLGLDWRLGEKYFMQWLIDGDEANNNGNWQWIASVGVDPAPVFRRIYNPASQQTNYDPLNAYVRTYVPELQNVPDKYMQEPWTMPEETQRSTGFIPGVTYPMPIVDHKTARVAALGRYHAAAQNNQ